jgi:hypothetical protein
MEILIKLTDITETSASEALREFTTVMEESRWQNEKLISKGRTKIDLVGTGFVATIQIKEDKQTQSVTELITE